MLLLKVSKIFWKIVLKNPVFLTYLKTLQNRHIKFHNEIKQIFKTLLERVSRNFPFTSQDLNKFAKKVTEMKLLITEKDVTFPLS